MIPIMPDVRWRKLLPGQVCEVCVIDATSKKVRVVHRSAHTVFEAPNWTSDGEWLIVNAAGSLYRIHTAGDGGPERIPLGPLTDINNDHVLSPNGNTIYVSSEGDGHLYAAPISGGRPVRISEERPGPFGYFVLGISTDGSTLAFTGADKRGGRNFVSNLYTMPSAGGVSQQLTDADVDSVGGAFSPAGDWLYFNSELASSRRGHAQVFRMRPDGSGIQQLTNDERVNWFPKPSPDDEWVVYLSFPPGTVGHEANVQVLLKAMKQDGSQKRTLLALFGGQGTMNVSSWAPDGRRFAFVRYPTKGQR